MRVRVSFAFRSDPTNRKIACKVGHTSFDRVEFLPAGLEVETLWKRERFSKYRLDLVYEMKAWQEACTLSCGKLL